MNRIKAALRALWRDPDAPVGLLETLLCWPIGRRHAAGSHDPPPARNLHDVRRILVWLSSPPAGRHQPPRAALLAQIIRGYNLADRRGQQLIREELAGQLEHANGPALRAVLALAQRIPLPEGKSSLLALLTRPTEADEAPPDAADAALLGAAAPKQNGRQSVDVQAEAIGALAVLRDPALEPLFRHLLKKFARGHADERRGVQLARPAAWGLCLLRPAAFPGELPAFLRNDASLINMLAGDSDPRVRALAREWVAKLPLPPDPAALTGLDALQRLCREQRSQPARSSPAAR